MVSCYQRSLGHDSYETSDPLALQGFAEEGLITIATFLPLPVP